MNVDLLFGVQAHVKLISSNSATTPELIFISEGLLLAKIFTIYDGLYNCFHCLVKAMSPVETVNGTLTIDDEDYDGGFLSAKGQNGYTHQFLFFV